jgi:dethiobiotin synthetase
MTAVFITATGTDIGKTFVSAGLIRHWRAAGRHVDALKPVATGFDPRKTAESDTGVLLAALGLPINPVQTDRISPWRFAAPLSPDMAASREGRSIDFNAVVEFSLDAIEATTDTLLIEGIGGIMVPLDHEHTVLDWMEAVRAPIVVVTGTYLGSLSHTLTCLDVLARRGLGIKALIVNETLGSNVSPQETAQTLLRFASDIPVVGLPRLAPAHADNGVFAHLASLVD